MMHRYLFEKQGADSMMDLRRVFWEKRSRLEELEQPGKMSTEPERQGERRELEEYVRHHAPNPSYMVNKGWQDAIEHLADCILDGRPCELASAEDGLKAMALSQAAVQSRRTGQISKCRSLSMKPRRDA